MVLWEIMACDIMWYYDSMCYVVFSDSMICCDVGLGVLLCIFCEIGKAYRGMTVVAIT